MPDPHQEHHGQCRRWYMDVDPPRRCQNTIAWYRQETARFCGPTCKSANTTQNRRLRADGIMRVEVPEARQCLRLYLGADVRRCEVIIPAIASPQKLYHSTACRSAAKDQRSRNSPKLRYLRALGDGQYREHDEYRQLAHAAGLTLRKALEIREALGL